jgi:hypothetical protein
MAELLPITVIVVVLDKCVSHSQRANARVGVFII